MSGLAGADALSAILRGIHLQAATFLQGEFSPTPTGGRAIFCHLVVEGDGCLHLAEAPRCPLAAGDFVLLPHGDPHEVSSVALTRVVSGCFSCDPLLGGFLLDALPKMIRVNLRRDARGEWLENLIHLAAGQSGAQDAGTGAVLAKLSETIFAEAVRRYLRETSAGDSGWPAGVQDPPVARALALLHNRPGHAWTIAGLAAGTGVSRSVLAERFTRVLGEPPIAYLTRWRLQLGAQMLRGSSRSVSEIARETGYASEAAFNRAFRRAYGQPPVRFRAQTRTAAANA